jgi:DNA integrity scanning protein DisA with diadenylate cyclase activity
MDVEEPENEVVTLLNQILKQLNMVRDYQQYLDKKVSALGKSCHNAFLQIKEAMGTLREELSENAGTLIDDTWGG